MLGQGDRANPLADLELHVARRREFVGAHYMTSPPATAIAWPVMLADEGRHSQPTLAATSSGWTNRACGFERVSSARASASLRPVFETILSTVRFSISVSV